MLLAVAGGPATPASAGAGHDFFDQLNGPFASFVVFPDQFGIDATKVVVDVPELVGSVDQARAQAFVESLAFPRTAEGPPQDREAAIELVTGTFEEIGYEPQFQSVVLDGFDEPNIYAELPGTQCPERVLVVGAHYDSATPGGAGADDNASGVAGLFELARALHDNPLPITVRLVSWSYEEEGLVGSIAMAERDQAQGTDVVGAVSLEMIGYTTPDIDPLTGVPGEYLAMVADPHSADLARAYGAGAFTYVPEFPAAGAIIDPTFLPDIYRSDHAAYALRGYQGLLVTDTSNFRNPNYHTIGDTPDTLDYEYLANSARAAIAGTATYAASDQDGDGLADLCGTMPTSTTTVETVAAIERRTASPRFTG